MIQSGSLGIGKMTEEEFVEKLAIIIIEHLKELKYGEIDYYYFFEDACDLLKKADPDRYNEIFNKND